VGGGASPRRRTEMDVRLGAGAGIAPSVLSRTGIHAGHPPQRPISKPTRGDAWHSQALLTGQALPHCE